MLVRLHAVTRDEAAGGEVEHAAAEVVVRPDRRDLGVDLAAERAALTVDPSDRAVAAAFGLEVFGAGDRPAEWVVALRRLHALEGLLVQHLEEVGRAAGGRLPELGDPLAEPAAVEALS